MRVAKVLGRSGWAAVTLAVVYLGCGGGSGVGPKEDRDVLVNDEVESTSSEIQRTLTITPVKDPQGVGSRADVRGRAVINTAAGYQRYFGHPAPSTVEFAKGDVVLFFATGKRPTGGYSVEFVSAASSFGFGLFATVKVTEPGPDCVVTQAESAPYALAKVRPVRKPLFSRIKVQRVVNPCETPPTDPPPPPPSCATVKCTSDTHCELVPVACIRAPCHPVPQCVPNTPPACMRMLCPPGTQCIEVPPPVACRIPPCAPIGRCVPIEPPNPGKACGGIAGLPCPTGEFCVDVPDDSCDPKNGGADCPGVCVQKAPDTKPCGDVSCGLGMTCCNASCGMCVKPGMVCVQIACDD